MFEGDDLMAERPAATLFLLQVANKTLIKRSRNAVVSEN